MTSWYRAIVPYSDRRAIGTLKYLFKAQGRPEAAAMFSCESGPDRLLYLSPAAHESYGLALSMVEWTPCERPSAHGLTLLVGPDDAWDLLVDVPDTRGTGASGRHGAGISSEDPLERD